MDEGNVSKAVIVKNLTKTFRIPTESSSGLKQKLINVLKGKKGYRVFTPLNDISFEIEKGDFFGIVGRNGSGKSTLLKSMASIYTPTKGNVYVEGTLVPFIELGVGFNPELSGRENVFLNGALLGFSRKEMESMYDDIINFAEIEDFMDEKLKNYSSGMQVRLAFSIAIRAQGDILLLDEVLAVGDESFQRKCYAYFAELKKEKKTVILVTHSMDAVQQFCNKALMIEDGKIVLQGNPAKVAQKYRELFIPQHVNSTQADPDDGKLVIRANNEIDLKNNSIRFDIDILSKIAIIDPVVTFEIIRDNGESVYRWVSDEKIDHSLNMGENKHMSIKLYLDNIFPDGTFTVQIGVKKRDRSAEYVMLHEATQFQIVSGGSHQNDTRWKPAERFTLD